MLYELQKFLQQFEEIANTTANVYNAMDTFRLWNYMPFLKFQFYSMIIPQFRI